jgi:hypothetical protein
MRVWPIATAVLTAAVSVVPGCGPSQAQGDHKVVKIADYSEGPLNVEVAPLEVRGLGGGDRFVLCPPPGEIGQAWIPEAFGDEALSDAPPPERHAGGVDPTYNPTAGGPDRRTATERASQDTHRGFKSCVRRGTAREGTHEGRAAIVLRLASDGTVRRAEEYAACGLPVEAIQCMKDVAAQLKFSPEEAALGPIVIPSVFTDRAGDKRRPTNKDAYIAGAFVTVEKARPDLHACERATRINQRPVEASATFTLTLNADGSVQHAHVEPWAGNKDLVECAGKAVSRLKFAPPPNGRGSVATRILFNPRN